MCGTVFLVSYTGGVRNPTVSIHERRGSNAIALLSYVCITFTENTRTSVKMTWVLYMDGVKMQMSSLDFFVL